MFKPSLRCGNLATQETKNGMQEELGICSKEKSKRITPRISAAIIFLLSLGVFGIVWPAQRSLSGNNLPMALVTRICAWHNHTQSSTHRDHPSKRYLAWQTHGSARSSLLAYRPQSITSS